MSCTAVTGAIATSSPLPKPVDPFGANRPTIVNVLPLILTSSPIGSMPANSSSLTVDADHDDLGVVGDVVGGEEAAFGDLVVGGRGVVLARAGQLAGLVGRAFVVQGGLAR